MRGIVLVVFLLNLFCFCFENENANQPFADFHDQKDIGRLEVCGGKCLSQYPEVETFLRDYSHELAGLQTLFTSEIPKLTLYDKDEEVVAQYDVSEMKANEILKILTDAGCYIINKKETPEEEEQLLYFLTNKLQHKNTKEILQNNPPGIRNFYLGMMYIKLEKIETAIQKYNLSIEEGYDESIMRLSSIYYEGVHYGIDSNFEKAFELLLLAEQKGISKSYSNIATLFLKGKGVEQNFAKGIEYLEKAALHNDTDGLIALGMIYHKGDIVELDVDKALEYYQMGLDNLKNPSTKKMVRKLISYAKGSRNLVKKDIEFLERVLDSLTN